jgi:hypothetical protein
LRVMRTAETGTRGAAVNVGEVVLCRYNRSRSF